MNGVECTHVAFEHVQILNIHLRQTEHQSPPHGLLFRGQLAVAEHLFALFVRQDGWVVCVLFHSHTHYQQRSATVI